MFLSGWIIYALINSGFVKDNLKIIQWFIFAKNIAIAELINGYYWVVAKVMYKNNNTKREKEEKEEKREKAENQWCLYDLSLISFILPFLISLILSSLALQSVKAIWGLKLIGSGMWQ